MLKNISEEYNGLVIVPMTLTNVRYFNEIIGKLREQGIVVKHFTLSAFKQTIEQRLRKRLEGKKSCAYQQMNDRMKELEDPLFKEYIQTDDMSIDQVVEAIAASASIDLLPDRRTKLGKSMNRLRITWKEMRIFK
ncbi:hypothetical protein GCM10028868_34930 [Virgibacillus kimchii]